MADSAEYIELCKTAKDAIRDVIKASEPGSGWKLHVAYNDLKAVIEKSKGKGADEPRLPESRDEEVNAERNLRWEHEKAWNATRGERRQRLILEALRSDRLTLREIAERLNGQHADRFGRVYDSMLRGEVYKMLAAGELEREREDFKNKPRFRYFRKPGLTGPIAELDALLDDDKKTEKSNVVPFKKEQGGS